MSIAAAEEDSDPARKIMDLFSPCLLTALLGNAYSLPTTHRFLPAEFILFVEGNTG